MSIAPLRFEVQVKAPPARAFEAFTRDIGRGWPKGKTPAALPHETLTIEPKVGGRWFERDAEGTDRDWGKVLVWEPPGRLVLGWQLDPSFRFDPSLLLEVEVGFAATADGGTRVTLEHRDLHRFGEAAEKTAASLSGGWPTRLHDFANFADANQEAVP